ncbi:MAG: HipA domain-containing protein [Armatimonadetes bacterium]|nr:HipA domain-containing protein [Armatimonadota bacterium]
MTDLRSLETLEVHQGGRAVGGLHRTHKGSRFVYTAEFLASDEEAIARHLPKSPEGVSVEGLANLPTFFAGLLPEGVMLDAVLRTVRTTKDDLFTLLAATGTQAIGDVTVRIPGETPVSKTLSAAQAAEAVQDVLKGGPSGSWLTAIPGVQPKISIGTLVRTSRKAHHILKFESPDFPGIIANEHLFMRLARRVGLDAATTQLRDGALRVQRFDRRREGEATFAIHQEDVLQLLDLYPYSKYSLDYSRILELGASLEAPRSSLLHLILLYAFSHLVGNGDLHAKNVSFQYDRSSRLWTATPAYDVLSTLPYADRLAGADRMALAYEDEAFGRFHAQEFAESGERYGIAAKTTMSRLRDMTERIRTVLPSLNVPPAVEPAVVAEIESRCVHLWD